MAILSSDQLTQYASAAGFSGQSLQDIVAIAIAESGGRTDAYNGSDPNGGSYGVLQINGIHFGNGTSQSCAYDPACAFRFAYSLSNGGNNFQPWSAYTSGIYRQHLSGGNVQPWYDYTSLNNYRQQYSGITYPVNGVDIPLPFHTPITALFSGTVAKEYVDNSGGVEIIQADDPAQLHGVPYYWYAHLDQFDVSQGAHISAGQEIGLSGGQNTGGRYNADPSTSTGPHLMIGESRYAGIPYTLSTLTPDLNPQWLLDYAKNTNLTSSKTCTCPQGYKIVQLQGFNVCLNETTKSVIPCAESTIQDPITAISNFFSSISKLTEWLNDPIRIVKLVFGILLIGGAIFLIASPQGQVARTITSGVRKVGIR